MYTVTILRSSPKSQTSFRDMLDPKRSKFGPTRPSMIGSPERVKIQRSLVQNVSKIQQRLKIMGCFLTFWGVKSPQGSKQLFGVKITSKIKSAPSNYSECKFSAKSDNF